MAVPTREKYPGPKESEKTRKAPDHPEYEPVFRVAVYKLGIKKG